MEIDLLTSPVGRPDEIRRPCRMVNVRGLEAAGTITHAGIFARPDDVRITQPLIQIPLQITVTALPAAFGDRFGLWELDAVNDRYPAQGGLTNC